MESVPAINAAITETSGVMFETYHRDFQGVNSRWTLSGNNALPGGTIQHNDGMLT